jgi:septal ring factor EnvC (AmiA/AmiB activator)
LFERDGRGVRHIVLAVIVTLLAVTIAPAPASAEDAASRRKMIVKEKRLEDVKKKIREERKNIDVMARKESSILGEIDAASRRIVKSRAELRRIEKKLKRVRSEITAATGTKEGLERERDLLSERLTRRLAAMYRMRRGEAVRVMFSSGTSASAARRHKYLTVIMDEDSGLIEEYEENIARIEAEKVRLASLGAQMDAERRLAAGARKRAESDRKRKKDLLSGIQRKKGEKAALVVELEEAAAELANILKDLRLSGDIIPGGEGFARMRGRLKMPVAGPVVSTYGKIRHPKFKTVTFNNGIIIDAPVGTSVKSVFGGRVVYTGWLKGYGQIMIVDNGDGYYTLFAYLSKILPERGQMVKGGEKIALVGDTGPRAAAGLYFEIRRRGVPKDPVPWFTARR